MPFLFPVFLGPAYALIALASLAFSIWMLLDATQRPPQDFPQGSKTPWIIGLAAGLLLGTLGLAIALAYYFLVRKPLGEGRPAPPLFSGAATARSSRTCPNCGDPLGTHARYCQNCGTSVGEDG